MTLSERSILILGLLAMTTAALFILVAVNSGCAVPKAGVLEAVAMDEAPVPCTLSPVPVRELVPVHGPPLCPVPFVLCFTPPDAILLLEQLSELDEWVDEAVAKCGSEAAKKAISAPPVAPAHPPVPLPKSSPRLPTIVDASR